MFVYSLTGKSGTGKSYQAMELSRDLGIEAIIDDGLFIYRDRVEAGKSAKREKTKVGAIKAAVFATPDHRDSVAARIREVAPETILVLGTSDGMADKICSQLGLPAVGKRIHIEDITTAEERETAAKIRKNQGKHVIPVPTLQLKRDFAGYFMDPMRVFRRETWKTQRDSEKTVVRPTYSYMGEFFIADSVIQDIAECLAEETDGITAVRRLYTNTAPDSLMITAQIRLVRGEGFLARAERFQRALCDKITDMTAFNVVKVDVEITGID
ncbi:MAG: hypothetical protein IIY88_08160 [Eubacterium sp.]|nr:hypothetical protein [Eubacterium sp.]